MEEEKIKINSPKKKLSRKTVSIITILAMADVLVMVVPFYLKNVMSAVTISNELGVLVEQFSQANSIYGYVALLSYFVGGYFADRINLKKLAFWGLLFVGLVSIWYGFLPFIETGKVAQLYVIFAIWSFITCFIFWSALWKLLSEQGTKEENGLLNGTHGSLNGIIGTVLIAIAYLVYYLFGTVWAESLGKWSFSTLVFIFTGFIVMNCILLWKFVPEPKKNENEEEKIKFDLHTFGKTLKNYKLWLVTLLILGVYMYQTGLSVFVTFMDNALAIGSVAIFVIGMLRTYLFRSIFSLPAGKLADRTQKYVMLIVIGLILASVLTTIAILLPGFNPPSTQPIVMKLWVQILSVAIYLCLGVACWALVTNRWGTIYEVGISQKEYAISVGFISFIAFSPDAWFWQIDSIIIANYKLELGLSANGIMEYNYQTANQISLSIIVGVGLLASIGGLILMIVLKRQKNKLLKNAEKLSG